MGLALSLVAMEKEKVKSAHQQIQSAIVGWLFVCESILPRVQVWYHVCANRGRGCYNTRLKEDGGCTIWYNEKEVNKDHGIFKRFSDFLKDSSSFCFSQLLSEIEEHLKCTITQCGTDIKVPVDEFDGKVTYGQRKALGGTLDATRLQIHCFALFLTNPINLVQVGTIRVTWTLWLRRFRSWPTLKEKLRHPSFILDTCQTSFSELSKGTLMCRKAYQEKEIFIVQIQVFFFFYLLTMCS